jgi:hypothetical protein
LKNSQRIQSLGFDCGRAAAKVENMNLPEPGSRVQGAALKEMCVQMVELLRSNDVVLLSFVRALLEAERIQVVELDQHASVMDGSAAMVQRRLMVDGDDEQVARQLLKDADLAHVLKP